MSEAAAPFHPDGYLDRQYKAATEALVHPASTAGGLVLVSTLVVFALSLSGSTSSAATIAITIVVLLLHESGHYVGMRIFGYRDVKMFFIPFFGAAVSGRRAGVASWKEAIVLLLGPMPGIALGGLLVASVPVHGPPLHNLTLQLLVINGLNLFPLGALDGGRLAQRLLFSRHRHLEVAFHVVAGVLLLAIAVRYRIWALSAFACLGLVGVGYRHRVLRAAATLREGLQGALDPLSLDEEQRRALFLAARDVVGERFWERPRTVATAMDQLLDAMRPAPGAGATVLLLVVWVAGLGGAAIVTIYALVTGPPSHWATRTLAKTGISVSMPYSPKSFVPADVGWTEVGVEGLVCGTRRRSYEIAVWSLAGEDGALQDVLDDLSSIGGVTLDDASAQAQHAIGRAGMTGREERGHLHGLVCRVQVLANKDRAVRLSACAARTEPQMDQFFGSLR